MIGIGFSDFDVDFDLSCVHFADDNILLSRARELFYYLKGGVVDFGEEHSEACGHSRFGRRYEEG